MENIAINWRLRKQRYRLIGRKCPICNITLFHFKQACQNCGYRFDVCYNCGCLYNNEECEPIIDDVSDLEIGC